MWWAVLILVVVIVVLWWLLRQNAQESEIMTRGEMAHVEEHAKTEAALAVEPGKPDDLTIIEGIGPKINSIFQSAGITTFALLADQDPSHLKEILENAGLRLGDPASWPEQAKLAAQGDWDALKALQDSLKGGRIVK